MHIIYVKNRNLLRVLRVFLRFQKVRKMKIRKSKRTWKLHIGKSSRSFIRVRSETISLAVLFVYVRLKISVLYDSLYEITSFIDVKKRIIV